MHLNYLDCYASLSDGKLVVGNGAVERCWDMTRPQPVPLRLEDKKAGKQWLTTDDCGEWLTFPPYAAAFYRRGLTVGGMRVLGMTAQADDDCGVALPHWRVSVRLAFEACEVEWVHIVYPGLPVLRSHLHLVAAGTAWEEERPDAWPDDFCDCLPLAVQHGRWKCVSFTDQTDDNDDLVFTKTGILTKREMRPLEGNLLFVQDQLSHAGLILVKEGPAVTGRLPGVGPDFFLGGMNLFIGGWGFSAQELAAAKTMDTYGAAVILWQGGEAAALHNLHTYHRAVRTFRPERDAQIMSNTWGDGNSDGRICEAFLMKELRRAAELGITYCQIDDGWEQGTTGNSVKAKEGAAAVWGEGYYQADASFWAINQERLPNGLEPLVSYAKEHGIHLGLWFSPDSERDFANWERDADTLLDLHRRYGVTAFKMDGLIFRSKLGEENFGRLMQKVVQGSRGKVFFNLDTTASVRNGYLGRVQYGTLFLENRFTNRFGHWPNYWPYRTLRNLWMLSRYLPTERLQIEFLNVARNIALYGSDPLSPAAVGQDYAFAVSMFASPLAWMELSGLDETAAARLKEQIAAYRNVQASVLGGHVLPIGEEPDGTQWTGLQSVGADGTGYLLVFRELHKEGQYTFRLWNVEDGVLTLEPILGQARQHEVTVRGGQAVFSLESPHSYALYRYQVKK